MSLLVVLTNTSLCAPVSNYNYEVLVGDGTPERSTTLARGKIEGHVREDGWQKLVQTLLDKERPNMKEYPPLDKPMEFCPSCGASIPHRNGEGRCERCMNLLPKETPQ